MITSTQLFLVPVPALAIAFLSNRADGVQLVENAAPGVIKQAQLCKFANTSCGGFEAVASRGYLWVTVMNTGYAAAQYTITVRGAGGCGSGVVGQGFRTGEWARQQLLLWS